MSDLTPAELSMRARLGAHASWANTTDRTARTAAARKAALSRFENQVDPEGTLDPEERHRRAQHARKAHMLKLSMAAAKGRRARAQTGGRPMSTRLNISQDDRDLLADVGLGEDDDRSGTDESAEHQDEAVAG